MGSCQLLPHGAYALFCAVISTLAWLASLFQDGCDFAQLRGTLVDQLTNDGAPYVDVGFAQYRTPIRHGDRWVVSYSGSCHSYSSNLVQIDGHWKAAKGFDFLALVLGGGGTLFLWFSTCFVFSRGTWRWAGYELLLASIFQAFAFLWFGTGICSQNNNVCSLSWGSRADIVACIFWFVTSMAILVRYPNPKDDIEEEGVVAAGGGDGGGSGGDHRHYETSISGEGTGGAPTFDAHGNVINERGASFAAHGGSGGSGSLHLTDIPLEGDANATLPEGPRLKGPTESMTDAEVV